MALVLLSKNYMRELVSNISVYKLHCNVKVVMVILCYKQYEF